MQTVKIIRQSNGLVLAEQIANLLENQFRFGKWGFGLGAILDLVPIGGDVLVLILSLSLLVIGMRMGLKRVELKRMLFNTTFAFLLGLVPVFGDAVYLLFRPNMRNVQILREHQ